jgi:hypothetical protein
VPTAHHESSIRMSNSASPSYIVRKMGCPCMVLSFFVLRPLRLSVS